MNLDSDLKRAFRRTSPPAGFSARVMERIGREPSSLTRRAAPWRAIAAGVMLTAAIGGWAAHEIAERRQGERAREELILAMHIAGEKVRVAQQHVREVGSK